MFLSEKGKKQSSAYKVALFIVYKRWKGEENRFVCAYKIPE
jgi:hypothetical protein